MTNPKAKSVNKQHKTTGAAKSIMLNNNFQKSRKLYGVAMNAIDAPAAEEANEATDDKIAAPAGKKVKSVKKKNEKAKMSFFTAFLREDGFFELRHYFVCYEIDMLEEYASDFLSNLVDLSEDDKLCRLAEHYNRMYYVEDDPVVSDYEYDMLMLEIKHLEYENPEQFNK